jgi:hypothetical protein
VKPTILNTGLPAVCVSVFLFIMFTAERQLQAERSRVATEAGKEVERLEKEVDALKTRVKQDEAHIPQFLTDPSGHREMTWREPKNSWHPASEWRCVVWTDLNGNPEPGGKCIDVPDEMDGPPPW